MADRKRLVQAIFISPLAALPIRLIDMAVTGTLWELSIGPQLLMVLIAALIAVVVVGLPIHFLLARKQLRHPAYYAIPGFFLPAAFLVSSLNLSGAGTLLAVWIVILVGISGACVALAFRYLALDDQLTKRANHSRAE